MPKQCWHTRHCNLLVKCVKELMPSAPQNQSNLLGLLASTEASQQDSNPCGDPIYHQPSCPTSHRAIQLLCSVTVALQNTHLLAETPLLIAILFTAE